jgi:N-acetylneuraminic acid mutarotase
MCVSFNSKKVFVFGGVQDNSESNKKVEVLDTSSMEWRPLKVELPLSFKGARLHFCLMVEGKFYMPPLAV